MRNIVILLLLCTFNVALSQTPGFTENCGQIADTDGKLRKDILFTAYSGKAEYYFMSDKIVTIEAVQERDKANSLLKTTAFTKKEISFKSILPFKNSTHLLSDVKVRFENPLTVKSNYYLPHCPDGITGVRSFKRVVYENIADNADLVFEISQSRKVLSFLKDKANNTKTAFSLASPDEVQANIITDPHVVYATYIGGSKNESDRGGVTADSKSNFWIAGETASPDFPMTDSAMERTKTAFSVIYISKFSTTGELLYSTFYSGASSSGASSVAVDSDDNVIVTGGAAGTKFPVSSGAFQSVNKGFDDAFIIKLDQQGKRVWATLFGGTGDDYAHRLAVDKEDNIIIAGGTQSANTLPVSPDAFQPLYGGGMADIFLAKFDKNGSRIWATYFGGSDNYQTERPFGGEWAKWVAIDSENNIIITGTTITSINFPTTEGAFQRDSSYVSDAFLAKFSPSGERLWCTLYGGIGKPKFLYGNTDDEGLSVAVDRNNNVIMAGYTRNHEFPVTQDAFLKAPTHELGAGYMIKFTPQGVRIWATYYSNGILSIKTDQENTIYVFGGGDPGENGVVESPNSIKMPNSDPGGMLIATFKEQQQQYVTNYPRKISGGSWPRNLAIAPNGNIALFGFTNTWNFAVTPNALMPINPHSTNGYDKNFLVILRDIATPTGIAETQLLPVNLKTFPNPSSELITVGYEESFLKDNPKYTITDILGRELYLTPVVQAPSSVSFDISSLSPGQYILSISSNGKITRTIFIKN